MYLGTGPASEKPDWSAQAQGLANDGVHWFFTHNDLADKRKSSMIKYLRNWRAVDGADEGRITSAGIPAVLLDLGINHFGDPDY